MTETTQRLNYRILDRLRPLVLEQMGLGEALRQLGGSWQNRHVLSEFGKRHGADQGQVENFKHRGADQVGRRPEYLL